jgi:hypothetical protein
MYNRTVDTESNSGISVFQVRNATKVHQPYVRAPTGKHGAVSKPTEKSKQDSWITSQTRNDHHHLKRQHLKLSRRSINSLQISNTETLCEPAIRTSFGSGDLLLVGGGSFMLGALTVEVPSCYSTEASSRKSLQTYRIMATIGRMKSMRAEMRLGFNSEGQ